MFSRDGAANTWTVKSHPQSIFVRGIVLFDHFVRSTRGMDTTPLLIRQNINGWLLCSLNTKQNELWWSDPIACRLMRPPQTFSDGNAHQRNSRRCLPHIWCSSYSSAVWETDGGPKTASVGAMWASVGVKHWRCCWLRRWMWRSQQWCVRRNRPMIFILFLGRNLDYGYWQYVYGSSKSIEAILLHEGGWIEWYHGCMLADALKCVINENRSLVHQTEMGSFQWWTSNGWLNGYSLLSHTTPCCLLNRNLASHSAVLIPVC
jgi:hypothetical protein